VGGKLHLKYPVDIPNTIQELQCKHASLRNWVYTLSMDPAKQADKQQAWAVAYAASTHAAIHMADFRACTHGGIQPAQCRSHIALPGLEAMLDPARGNDPLLFP